jgi:uncharacterized DUF497 family protein
MQFEWDDNKNKLNIRKHGIDFNDVLGMFNHDMLSYLDLRSEYGEDRWISIGWLNNVLGIVVYVERYENTIRIISARKATNSEVKKYEKYIKN